MAIAERRSRIQEIIPFAMIWMVLGVVYTMVVHGALGDAEIYPATCVHYHFPSVLMITTVSSTLMGLGMGLLERGRS